MSWQHEVPQKLNARDAHVATPKSYRAKKRATCKICGLPIINFPENEGPEGLKAFFRF